MQMKTLSCSGRPVAWRLQQAHVCVKTLVSSQRKHGHSELQTALTGFWDTHARELGRSSTVLWGNF